MKAKELKQRLESVNDDAEVLLVAYDPVVDETAEFYVGTIGSSDIICQIELGDPVELTEVQKESLLDELC